MFELRAVERPYPGLRAFEPHEAEIFFGREAHTDRLLGILKRERFLAVIGRSGPSKYYMSESTASNQLREVFGAKAYSVTSDQLFRCACYFLMSRGVSGILFVK